MQWYTVYVFRNKKNHKCYVGQTNNIFIRVLNHFYNKRGAKAFHRAIKKYGCENFELIETIIGSKIIINKLEEDTIKKYKSLVPRGYNIIPNHQVHRWWEFASKSKRQKFRKTISLAKLGTKHSEETKRKMSIAHKGHIFSEESKEHFRQGQRNAVSDEAKARIEKILELLAQGKTGTQIASMVGCTPEYIYKIKLGQRGSSVTGEIKATVNKQTGAKRNSEEAQVKIEQIKKLLSLGKSPSDVSKEIRCSKAYISNLKKKGIVKYK